MEKAKDIHIACGRGEKSEGRGSLHNAKGLSDKTHPLSYCEKNPPIYPVSSRVFINV